MKIVLGCDHRGAKAIHTLADHLRATGHEATVLGAADGERSDYPDSAYLVGNAVASGTADLGILICGSGIGMSMAANKVHGIRAALAHDEFTAEMGRRHNNANILCMPGDLCTQAQIQAMAESFLEATFEGGRHERRVQKIAAIENGQNPAEISANAVG